MTDREKIHREQALGAAAERKPLDDAITPISGAYSVPLTARPHNATATLPRRNWQGAGIVAAFALLFAVGLIAFIIWKGPANTNTAQQNNQTQSNPDTNQSAPRFEERTHAKQGQGPNQPGNKASAANNPEPK